MKKTLLSTAVLLLLLGVNAQTPENDLGSPVRVLEKTVYTPVIDQSIEQIEVKHKSNNRGTTGTWLNYVVANSTIKSKGYELSTPFLNPDANTIIAIDAEDFNLFNTSAGAWASVSQVFDPSSTVYGYGVTADEENFSQTTTQVVDSAMIYYTYTRGGEQSSSESDTLIVYIIPDTAVREMTFSSGTVPAPFIGYDYTKNKPSSPLLETYKLALGSSDETTLGTYKFSLNSLALGAGEKVAIAVSYKYGSATSAGDTIINATTGAAGEGEHHGYLRIFMCEEDSIQAPTAFNKDAYLTYNMGGTIDKDQLANTAGSYNGSYYPGTGWGATFGFEHVYVDWLVQSSTSVAISETNNDLNAVVYPNPANHKLTFNITNEADEMSITLYNIYGQIIYNETSTSTTFNNVLDVSDFAKGTYILKITNAFNSIENKILIQ